MFNFGITHALESYGTWRVYLRHCGRTAFDLYPGHTFSRHYLTKVRRVVEGRLTASGANNTGRNGMNVGPVVITPACVGGYVVTYPNGGAHHAATELEAENVAHAWAILHDVPCDIRWRR